MEDFLYTLINYNKYKQGVKMNIISWKPKPKVLVNDIDSVLDSFFQNDWSFEKKKNIVFEQDSQFEDVDAEAFDFDQDGDVDIYVMS